MAEHEGAGLNLDAWTELTPDPAAMDRVTALMVAGVQPQESTAPEPGEAQFRLLTIIWGALALVAYLAWDLLSSWWGALHPAGAVAVIICACASLGAPFVLVPLLRRESDEGGTSLC